MNQIGYRVVSTYVGPRNLLRWKVQRFAEEGESRWEDFALTGINLFETTDEAIGAMNERIVRDRATVPQ